MMRAEDHIGLPDLELLTVDGLSLSREQEDRVKEIREHLIECFECADTAKLHLAASRFKTHKPEVVTSLCPPVGVWLELIDGVLPELRVSTLSAHAALCKSCAADLKLAQDLSRICIDAEVEQLKSSGEEWQEALATRMHHEARGFADTTTPRNVVTLKPLPAARRTQAIWIGAVAAMVVAAAGGATYSYWSSHSVNRLLAAAYNERRPNELRIPGGDDVSIYSPVRGGARGLEGSQLLQLKLRAEEGLRHDPESARWNEVAGEVALLEKDWETALANLQAAQLKDPSLPRLEFDIGMAYFERAETRNEGGDYGRAAEHFKHFLERQGNADPVTLYNLGLSLERSGETSQALAYYQQALQLETSSDWKRVIGNRIQLVKAAISRVGQSQIAPAGQDDRYEVQLADMVTGTIPDPIALQRIAMAGMAHGDLWPNDWLRSGARTSNAGQALKLAARNNREGRPAQALQEAKSAVIGFRSGHNQSGELRALAEVAYANQRVGRAQDCLVATRAMHASAELKRSSYLLAFATLEEANCFSMLGSLNNGRWLAKQSLDLAKASFLPQSAVRAHGILAALTTNEGLADEGWRMNSDGLNSSGEAQTPRRRYQYLSDITQDAVAIGIPEVAAMFAADAAQTAEQTGDHQNIAYAYEILGECLSRVGQFGRAEKSFARADAELKTIDDSGGARVFRADWSSKRAELTATQGDVVGALHSIRAQEAEAGNNQDIFVAKEYWLHRARIELLNADAAGSQQSARKAVSLASGAARQLNHSEGREAWRRDMAPAYQALIDALLRSGQVRPAFAAWRDSRKPALDNTTTVRSEASGIGFKGPILVYVRLPERYIVFVQRTPGSDLVVKDLPGSPAQIVELARSFAQLCADPNSSDAALSASGLALFRILVRPAEVSGVPLLAIETTDELSSLPFAALRLEDGKYLGEETELVQLSGLRDASVSEDRFSPSSRVEVASSPDAVGDTLSGIPTIYDESSEIVRYFPAARLTRADALDRASLLRRVSSSDIFHFGGHTAQGRDEPGLVLNSIDRSLLTASSLSETRLSSRLVVLAACRSAGDQSGSEQTELAEAFLRAGAHQVVASKWSVDSKATRLLMLAFYRELAKGERVATALMRAEGEIRHSRPDLRHPYYWAGFSVVDA